MGLLPEVACVYLGPRSARRASERWLRLCLLINKELVRGTHKMALFLFLAPFGMWMYGGGEGCLGHSCSTARGLTHGISTGPYFSIS